MPTRHYDVARMFLRTFGLRPDRVDEIIKYRHEEKHLSESGLFDFLNEYLSDPGRRPLFIRTKARKTFSELNEPEQRLLKRLLKNPKLEWLNGHFGLIVDRGNKEVRLFKEQMVNNDFKLPTSMVSEILKVISLYEK